MGKTSSAVKNKWNEKHYGRISIMVEKELVEAFKEKCKEDGVPMARVFREAMKAYLEKE